MVVLSCGFWALVIYQDVQSRGNLPVTGALFLVESLHGLASLMHETFAQMMHIGAKAAHKNFISHSTIVCILCFADVADNSSRWRLPPQREGLLLRLHRDRANATTIHRSGKIRLRATGAEMRGELVAFPLSTSLHGLHVPSRWGP